VLVETEPASWLPGAGEAPAPVTVIDADVSAVLAGAVDKVLRVQADPPHLLHVDIQSGPDSARFARRLRLYNILLKDRHELPARSVGVILRPEADSPQLTGLLESRLPGEVLHSVFRCGVVRVWQLPVESLLAGGLGTLPLAPISGVREAELPRVIRRKGERLRHEGRARELWVATRVLLGLRYPKEPAETLLRGVLGMKESVTYQAIVAEGLAEGRARGLAEGLAEGECREARKLLLRLGRKRLGPPDRAMRAAVEAIAELPRLEELTERLLDVGSWQELLAPARPRRRNGSP